MRLVNKLLAYLRLIKIKEVRIEQEHLENILFDAWKDHGNCTYSQRIEAAKNLVEKIKIDSTSQVRRDRETLLKSENDNDKAKSISFFGIL